MQKKLIALALAGLVAAPVAMAQSNVTIYGVLDIGYVGKDKETNGVDTKTTDFGSMSALQSSRLGFRGTEDLGNGLKAHFNYELGINNYGNNANLADPFGVRLANLGLSGNFGSLTIGRQSALNETVWGIGNAGMSNNVEGALYTSGVKQDESRYSSVVTYATPNFSGFTAAVQYGTTSTESETAAGVDTADDKYRVAAANVKYANGPLNVSLGYSTLKNEGLILGAQQTTEHARTWALAANYDFKVVKVFGLYVDGKNYEFAGGARRFVDTDDVGGYELGVHVPVGSQLTLMASMYRGENENSSATDKRSSDLDGFQLGALYALSKRTTAYVMYGDYESDGRTTTIATGTRANNDAEGNSVALGIRHTF